MSRTQSYPIILYICSKYIYSLCIQNKINKCYLKSQLNKLAFQYMYGFVIVRRAGQRLHFHRALILPTYR